ncbi:Cartilage intermediate layer protein [Desmophyllum pertusum]|uniref:Cartilage intermediate layer protein n=1 Tax=Desmophyllum pertusum TaxID=174260 RepID=A0A9X0D638_9CNID|nr:Cartilage intermediate layer protein [Desmophyllum pertusum]
MDNLPCLVTHTFLLSQAILNINPAKLQRYGRQLWFSVAGLVSLIAAVRPPLAGERCEKGWRLYGGNCYFRENNKRETWQGAQDVCAKKQANLVTVNDADEQKFVAGIVGNRGSWCGLNNQDNKNEFKWVSGEQSGYTLWAPKEPSKSKKKRCAHILSAKKDNKWEMSKCASKYRFICEKGRCGTFTTCASKPCKNGGSCSEQGKGYKCQCTDKFTGDKCETEIVADPCDPNPCLSGGTCTADNKGYLCQCPDKFTGDRCEQALDPCIINPCQNEGKCHDLGNMQFYCQCERGFTGNNCEKVNCQVLPCKNGGTCLDIDDRSFCKCISGFTGNICQGELPSITKDPENTIGLEGDDATLCCEAKGTPTPEYTWFLNGAPLAESTSRLRLTSLSSGDAGLYRCRATNEFGTILSSEAQLTVVAGSGDDSCDSTPLKKDVTLPLGCTEDSSGSNSVDVGTCSYAACIKRNQGDASSCGGQQSTRQCCSPAAMSDSPVTCGNGETYSIQKVTSCACAECTVPDMVVRGKVVDPDGNPVKKGEITVGDGDEKYSTDLKGNFNFRVKSGTKRLVLTVKDKLQGLLEDTTKPFTLHEGQVSFYTIVLQRRRLQSNSKLVRSRTSLLVGPVANPVSSNSKFLQVPSLQLMEQPTMVRSQQTSE